jgi:hypothetical protein
MASSSSSVDVSKIAASLSETIIPVRLTIVDELKELELIMDTIINAKKAITGDSVDTDIIRAITQTGRYFKVLHEAKGYLGSFNQSIEELFNSKRVQILSGTQDDWLLTPLELAEDMDEKRGKDKDQLLFSCMDLNEYEQFKKYKIKKSLCHVSRYYSLAKTVQASHSEIETRRRVSTYGDKASQQPRSKYELCADLFKIQIYRVLATVIENSKDIDKLNRIHEILLKNLGPYFDPNELMQLGGTPTIINGIKPSIPSGSSGPSDSAGGGLFGGIGGILKSAGLDIGSLGPQLEQVLSNPDTKKAIGSIVASIADGKLFSGISKLSGKTDPGQIDTEADPDDDDEASLPPPS